GSLPVPARHREGNRGQSKANAPSTRLAAATRCPLGRPAGTNEGGAAPRASPAAGSRQPRRVLQRTRPQRTDEERGTPRRPPDARDRSERQRVRAMDGWSVPVGIRMSRAPTVKRRAGRHATSWSEPVVSPPASSAQSVARTAGADGTMALVPRGTHLALLSVGLIEKVAIGSDGSACV